MVHHAPALAHAAAGNHDDPVLAVQCARLIGIAAGAHAGEIERVVVLLEHGARLRIQIVQMVFVDPGDIDGERAIDIDAVRRHVAALPKLAQLEEQILRAFQREGGNHHVASRLLRPVDRVAQLLHRLFFAVVQAVAVGGFAEDQIDHRRRRGVGHHVAPRGAEIPEKSAVLSFSRISMAAEPRIWPDW